MGNEFKAASGRTVNVGADGSVMFGPALGYLSREAAFDAEELFRAKRDADLGLWRSPLDPDWVAIEGEPEDGGRRTVVLVNERTLEREWLNDRILEFPTIEDAPHRAGRAFFVAHPKVEPWHKAQAGEFWSIMHTGQAETCRVDEVNGTLRFVGVDGQGLSVSMPVTHHSITAGRRMVAEVAA